MSASALLPRRSLFAGLFGALATSSVAAVAAPRLRDSLRESIGTTLYLELDSAPFPAPGAGYKDNTVVVFVPKHHRVFKDGRLDCVVHFHGHGTTAEKAIAQHQLRGQVADSKQNVILICPQGPVNAADNSIGKLELPNGLARMLVDVQRGMQTAQSRKALGPLAIPGRTRVGNVIVSGHSGGFHAVASCLKHGGVDVREAWLFDALYSDVEVFRDWALARRGAKRPRRHKLVSYYTDGTTAGSSRQLMADLMRGRVRCEHEKTEGELTVDRFIKAEALFIHTGLSHSGCTHELNNFRDLLYAAELRGRTKAPWYTKKGPRRLDRRVEK